MSPLEIEAAGFDAGVAQIATVKVTQPNAYVNTAPTVHAMPAPKAFHLRALDTDAASSLRSAANSSLEGGVLVASGRLLVSNAYGSELLKLPVPVTAQYWTGARWATSSTDNASRFAPTDVLLSNCRVGYKANAICAAPATIDPAIPTITLVRGMGRFRLNATNTTTTVDMQVTAPLWLPSTKARAKVGVFKSPVIYIREVY